jgi:hypothetical protein
MGVTTNISVSNIAGWLEGTIGKYIGGGNITAPKKMWRE